MPQGFTDITFSDASACQVCRARCRTRARMCIPAPGGAPPAVRRSLLAAAVSRPWRARVRPRVQIVSGTAFACSWATLAGYDSKVVEITATAPSIPGRC